MRVDASYGTVWDEADCLIPDSLPQFFGLGNALGRKKTAGPQAPKMVRVHVAAHELGLHPFTVRRWITQGKIQAVRVGLEARIPRVEIGRLVVKTNERLLILYGRVSGQGQRDDPTTQFARLEQWADTQRPGQRHP